MKDCSMLFSQRYWCKLSHEFSQSFAGEHVVYSAVIMQVNEERSIDENELQKKLMDRVGINQWVKLFKLN